MHEKKRLKNLFETKIPFCLGPCLLQICFWPGLILKKRYSKKEKSLSVTLFIFYKNVVFPAQTEYSYFSADFRLKIFLYYS